MLNDNFFAQSLAVTNGSRRGLALARAFGTKGVLRPMREPLPVVPAHGLLAMAGQVRAIMWAELVMQWRRRGLWITFACATVLLVLLTVQAAIGLLHLPPNSIYIQQHYTPEAFNNLMVEGVAIYGIMFFGLLASLLVVDRLERDRTLGMQEIQGAMPHGSMLYILGKFLGNYVAVCVPTLLAYLLCALLTLLAGWPVVLLARFLLAYLLVFVPASLAAVGLTFWLASFLPVRIVQISFSLLWFYFNTGLGRFGFGGSIFNPSGLYIYPIFFPTPPPLYSMATIQASLPIALLNIAVLLLTALVMFGLTCGSQAFRRSRGARG